MGLRLIPLPAYDELIKFKNPIAKFSGYFKTPRRFCREMHAINVGRVNLVNFPLLKAAKGPKKASLFNGTGHLINQLTKPFGTTT